MAIDAFTSSALTALSTVPTMVGPAEIDPAKHRNAVSAIALFLVERLRTADPGVKKLRNTTFSWAGGIVNMRNGARRDMWTNIRLRLAETLHEQAAQRPVVYLMTCWEPGAAILHAWAIPESIIYQTLPRLNVEKDPGKKTITIKPGVHRFGALTDSPDLSAYYGQVRFTDAERSRLAEAVKADEAAGGSDTADDDLADDSDDADQAASIFTSKTVSFLRELPQHKTDPVWHEENRARYERDLREPTSSLLQALRSQYIEPLDREVAGGKNQTSRLKKNDYGRGGYHDHFWFAFYDPAAGNKIKSSQLYFILRGSQDRWDYGFSNGDDCEPYVTRLVEVVLKNAKAVAEFIATAPTGTTIRLKGGGLSKEYSAADWAGYLRGHPDHWLGLDTPVDSSGTLDEISILRGHGLAELPDHSEKLHEDVGQFFQWVWPVFQASRNGTWPTTASSPTTKQKENEESVDVDEEAPRTLKELAAATSLAEHLLQDIEDALLAKHQLVLTGPPGTSKTYIARQFARYFARGGPERPQGVVNTLYVHANWTYEDFFEGLRPSNAGTFSFSPRDGLFLKWVDEELKGKPVEARHVLILDELNRCDTAAVLGELLQLLEYPGETIPLMSGRPFAFPRNLYVIGTMNSADRSVGRLDLALRRRFFWIDLHPQPDTLQRWLSKPGNNPVRFDAGHLSACNTLLKQKSGIPPEQQIGHALFMGQSGDADQGTLIDLPLTEQRLRQVVRFSVLPYVRELLTMNTGSVDEGLLGEVRNILFSCLRGDENPQLTPVPAVG